MKASESYDGESLRWPTRRWPFPRLRKVAVYLFLIDLTIISLLVYSIKPLIALLFRNHELFEPQFTPAGQANDTREPWHHRPGGPEIPRILHQTCATLEIPEQWIYPQHTCKEAYAGFEYKLWTDELARNFIAKEYPWFLEVWDNYPFPIQRADAIRYFVLHHFGGIYLDMDTVCQEPFPIQEIPIESPNGDVALFKSTRPTGITNDFMVATANHPAYTSAITKLPVLYGIIRLWARMEPYAAIMLSTGPLFLSLAVKDFLVGEPSLPSPTVQVIDPSLMNLYITDLQSSTWHKSDTQVFLWMGERPWSWFGLGFLGLVIGVYVMNRTLLFLSKAPRKIVHALRRARKFSS